MSFCRYTCGVQWHIVLDEGPWLQGMGDLGSNPQSKHAIANCSQTVSPMLPPGEYKRGVEWTCHSDSAFCQITLVLVIIVYVFNVIFFIWVSVICCCHFHWCTRINAAYRIVFVCCSRFIVSLFPEDISASQSRPTTVGNKIRVSRSSLVIPVSRFTNLSPGAVKLIN